MLLKKLNRALLLLVFFYTSYPMETVKLATNRYRMPNNVQFIKRDYDDLLHKLRIIKKRKKSIKHIHSQVDQEPIILEPERDETAIKTETLLDKEPELTSPIPESLLTIFEDMPSCVKERDAALAAQAHETRLLNKRRKMLGYKNYVAKFTMRKGKLVLRKDFPNL